MSANKKQVPKSSYDLRNSSAVFVSSSKGNLSSNVIRESSSIIKLSSNSFESSSDIIKLLKEHPNFARAKFSGLSAERLNAIAAAILSGLALAGGVALIVISWGAVAGPGIVLATSMLIGTGTGGITSSVRGIITNDFSWQEWSKRTASSALLTLLTFGAGYGAGNLAGMALVGTLTEVQVKTVGSLAGALVGGSTRPAVYTLISKIEDRPLEAFNLIIESAQGILGGAYAGFVGARTAIINYEKACTLKHIVDKVNNQTLSEKDCSKIIDRSEGKSVFIGQRGAHSRIDHVYPDDSNTYALMQQFKNKFKTFFFNTFEQDKWFRFALTDPNNASFLEKMSEAPSQLCIEYTHLNTADLMKVFHGGLEYTQDLEGVRVLIYSVPSPTSGELLIHVQTLYAYNGPASATNNIVTALNVAKDLPHLSPALPHGAAFSATTLAQSVLQASLSSKQS